MVEKRNAAAQRRNVWPLCVATIAVLAFGMLAIAPNLVAQTPPSGALDQIALEYQLASRGWLGRVLAVTTNLFFWLALIEFVIAGLMYMIATPQAREAAAGRLLVKIMLISFVYMLITQSSYWLVRLIDSFAGVGEYATGRFMSPSDIVAYGTVLSGEILDSVDTMGMITNPPVVIYIAFTALLVLISYILIAVQVVITLVHSYILLSAGIFFLAFAAFRATVSFAENYLLACVHAGVKLMILHFVVALGEPLTRRWAELLANDRFLSTDYGPIIEVLAGVTILAF
ncbi:MAG: type IV secretion system protein, partial [Nitriliruptorales bacterium]